MIQKSVGSSPTILVCLILMLGYQFMIQTKIRGLKKMHYYDSALILLVINQKIVTIMNKKKTVILTRFKIEMLSYF